MSVDRLFWYAVDLNLFQVVVVLWLGFSNAWLRRQLRRAHRASGAP
jgi:hypothetical protein